MARILLTTTAFEKDLRRVEKQGKDLEHGDSCGMRATITSLAHPKLAMSVSEVLSCATCNGGPARPNAGFYLPSMISQL